MSLELSLPFPYVLKHPDYEGEERHDHSYNQEIQIAILMDTRQL